MTNFVCAFKNTPLLQPGWTIGSSCPRLGLCLDSALSTSTSSGTQDLLSWRTANHTTSSYLWLPTTSSKLCSACGFSKRQATSGWLVATIGFVNQWTFQILKRACWQQIWPGGSSFQSWLTPSTPFSLCCERNGSTSLLSMFSIMVSCPSLPGSVSGEWHKQ